MVCPPQICSPYSFHGPLNCHKKYCNTRTSMQSLGLILFMGAYSGYEAYGNFGGGGHFHIRLVGYVPTSRLSVFNKNSRTGISKVYNFPEQVKFILKALLVVKNSHLYINFSRTGISFPKKVSRTGSKKCCYIGTSTPIYLLLTPPPRDEDVPTF